jgi:hypothetical protein
MKKSRASRRTRPRTCSINWAIESTHPMTPDGLFLEWPTVPRGGLQQVFRRSLLGALQFPLLLLFLLTLLGKLLLTLLESVISLWQKCSRLVEVYHSSRPSSSRKAATATSDGILGDSLNACAASRKAGDACCPLRRRNWRWVTASSLKTRRSELASRPGPETAAEAAWALGRLLRGLDARARWSRAWPTSATRACTRR